MSRKTPELKAMVEDVRIAAWSKPTVFQYVSIIPSTKFKLKDIFLLEFKAGHQRDLYEDAGIAKPDTKVICHFVAGAGAKQYGLHNGVSILYDGTDVYRRVSLVMVGRKGASGLKAKQNGHLCWFIQKITTIPVEKVAAMFIPS
jgi:hypothetical protein